MRRIPLLTMALTVCAAVCLSPRLTAADDANMQKAMDAVYGKTGVQKKLSIRGHKFNVKPAKFTTKDGVLTIKGNVSHHLPLRDDDEIDYVITKKNGQILDIKIDIDRSTMQAVLKKMKDAIKVIVKEIVVEALTDSASSKSLKGSTATRTAPKAQLDLMEKALAKAEELSSKGWEGGVQLIIANVAIRSNDQGGDALVQLRKMVKPVGTPGKPGGNPVKRP